MGSWRRPLAAAKEQQQQQQEGGGGGGGGSNGSDLVLAEAELALAKFELETQEQEQAVRQKEHRRQLVCLGEPVDADAELALLEAQHGLSRAALDRLLSAEEAAPGEAHGARAQAEGAGGGSAREARRPRGEEEYLGVLAKIDEERGGRVAAASGAGEEESDFFIAQFDEKHQRERDQCLDFNGQLRALCEQHEKSSHEVRAFRALFV